jgi:hypothetical protein
VLATRIVTVLSFARVLLSQTPSDRLDIRFIERQSTYRQHVRHIFCVVQAFLNLVATGKRLEFSAYVLDISPSIKPRGIHPAKTAVC